MSPAAGPDQRASWVAAIVGSLALLGTLGTPFSYGIFVEPFGDAYGLSAGALGVVFAVHMFAAYSISGGLAVVATRWRPNRVLIAIGVSTLVISPALYHVQSFLGLLVLFTVLGAALGSALIVLVSVIPLWFDAHRGLATGLLFAGIGLSLFIMPPTWHFAFTVLGLQTGFLAVVGVTGSAIVISGLVCRHPPWISQAPVPFRALGMWLQALLKTRQFYYLLIGFGLAFAWFFLIAGYGVPYFEYRGLGRGLAAFAFGSIGGVSIISRLASGAIADRLGYSYTYLLGLGVAIPGCVALLLPGVMPLAAAIVLFGLSLGAVTTLFVPIVLDIYDPDKTMAIIGIFSIGLGITALAAPPVALLVVSATESYSPVIGLTLATVIGAMAFMRLGTK